MKVELITKEDIAEILSFMKMQAATIAEQHKELLKLKDNRLMSVDEVVEYTGFSRTWVLEKKEEIGYAATGKDLRFYKEDIDAFFRGKFIQMKKK